MYLISTICRIFSCLLTYRTFISFTFCISFIHEPQNPVKFFWPCPTSHFMMEWICHQFMISQYRHQGALLWNLFFFCYPNLHVYWWSARQGENLKISGLALTDKQIRTLLASVIDHFTLSVYCVIRLSTGFTGGKRPLNSDTNFQSSDKNGCKL